MNPPGQLSVNEIIERRQKNIDHQTRVFVQQIESNLKNSISDGLHSTRAIMTGLSEEVSFSTRAHQRLVNRWLLLLSVGVFLSLLLSGWALYRSTPQPFSFQSTDTPQGKAWLVRPIQPSPNPNP